MKGKTKLIDIRLKSSTENEPLIATVKGYNKLIWILKKYVANEETTTEDIELQGINIEGQTGNERYLLKRSIIDTMCTLSRLLFNVRFMKEKEMKISFSDTYSYDNFLARVERVIKEMKNRLMVPEIESTTIYLKNNTTEEVQQDNYTVNRENYPEFDDSLPDF